MNQEIQFIFGFFKVKKLSVHAGIKNRHAFFQKIKIKFKNGDCFLHKYS